MEGPGGYFLEPGSYIVDKRNTKDWVKSVYTYAFSISM
jgi:hypothetical protein